MVFLDLKTFVYRLPLIFIDVELVFSLGLGFFECLMPCVNKRSFTQIHMNKKITSLASLLDIDSIEDRNASRVL